MLKRRKRLSVGENSVVDQEAIYARVIGLLVSQRDLDLQQVLATELAAYLPSMFSSRWPDAGCYWKVHAKEQPPGGSVTALTDTCPTAIVVDVSAVLWTVHWPANGTVDTFISGFKEWLSVRLFGADVYLCFDRYRDYSTKSTIRSARAAATRVHQLDLRTPLPARDAVLKNSANKAQLNSSEPHL